MLRLVLMELHIRNFVAGRGGSNLKYSWETGGLPAPVVAFRCRAYLWKLLAGNGHPRSSDVKSYFPASELTGIKVTFAHRRPFLFYNAAELSLPWAETNVNLHITNSWNCLPVLRWRSILRRKSLIPMSLRIEFRRDTIAVKWSGKRKKRSCNKPSVTKGNMTWPTLWE